MLKKFICGAYVDPIEDDAKFCNLILTNCNRVEELKFYCSNDNYFQPRFTFGNLLVAEYQSTNNIKKVSVNVEGFKGESAADLVKFLLKLPKLEIIDLHGSCWGSDAYTTILHRLCEYVRTFIGRNPSSLEDRGLILTAG